MKLSLVLLLSLPILINCFFLSEHERQLTSFDEDELGNRALRHKRGASSSSSESDSDSESSEERGYYRRRPYTERFYWPTYRQHRWQPTHPRAPPTTRAPVTTRASPPPTTSDAQEPSQNLEETETHVHTLSNGGLDGAGQDINYNVQTM
uniref:Uncharacterized protein n=1 Tax=Biomphalaria glabrata TaxID=6526 RepID=A0A2C9M324_BIOGL